MKFHAWLMKNRWRADRIGDIARDVHGDTTWPRKANSWIEVKGALPATAIAQARRALRAAWNEYELYVGGASHLHQGTWIGGVAGNFGLPLPEETKRGKRTKTKG